MTAELPLSIEERLARLEKMFNKLNAPPLDLLLQEGYFQIGSSGNSGATRIDQYGLQLATGGSVNRGIYFVDSLETAPDSADPAIAYIAGSADDDTGATKVQLAVADLDPPNADVAAAQVNVETFGTDIGRVTQLVYVDGNLTGGGEWSEAWLNRVYGEDAGTFQLYQALLRLCPTQVSGYPFTSDPANAIEGDIWYNTTDNQFKFYEGSTIKTLGGGGMPTPIAMGPSSLISVGVDLASRSAAAPTSATYPAANRAILFPFYVTEDITVTQLWAYNGATASGNIDVGIYDSAFTRVISSGSTAQSGTSVLQVFNVTDTPLSAGQYYMAVAMDNTTGTLFRSGQQADFMRSIGCFQMASAFALPTTITPAAVASNYLPHVGWTRKTTI